MELKSKIKNIYQNLVDDCYEIVLQANLSPAEIEPLLGKDLRVKLTKWSEKRSLDANSYLWVLCTKLAEVHNSSKDEIYEECIQKYGYVDDPPIVVTVKSHVDMSTIDGHWKLIRSNGEYSGYMRIRGSSTYTKSEMAHFLDMVVQDAKDSGVETLTPAELERMKNDWVGTPTAKP